MTKSGHTTIYAKSLSVLALVIGMLANNPVSAAPSSEIQSLTVAFLYNFMKLSEWPPSIGSKELTLCVIQADDYAIDVDSLAGKEVQSYTLKVKHIVQGDTISECQLLYIPENEKPIRIREWLETMANTAMLTVSGVNGFLEQGGMIELVSEGNHLQFEVNLEPVEKVGIKLSSKMLQIAREVRGN